MSSETNILSWERVEIGQWVDLKLLGLKHGCHNKNRKSTPRKRNWILIM